MAIEARGKGLMGIALRYPYEIRDGRDYFEDIPDEKIPKDMLDLAAHIVDTKTGDFEPSKFEDQYEDAVRELLRRKQQVSWRPGSTLRPRSSISWTPCGGASRPNAAAQKKPRRLRSSSVERRRSRRGRLPGTGGRAKAPPAGTARHHLFSPVFVANLREVTQGLLPQPAWVAFAEQSQGNDTSSDAFAHRLGFAVQSGRACPTLNGFPSFVEDGGQDGNLFGIEHAFVGFEMTEHRPPPLVVLWPASTILDSILAS
jgi:hypothetical protein